MKTTTVFAIAASALMPMASEAHEFVGTIIDLSAYATNSTSKFHTNVVSDICREGESLDFTGGDFMTVRGGSDTCCKACRDHACEAYTWTDYEGGTCWLKNKVLTPKIYIGARGCIPGWDIPKAARFANCDMPGNDIRNEYMQTATECEFMCWAGYECKASTWTSYGGGRCYFKSRVTECVYNPGVSTGVALNQQR